MMPCCSFRSIRRSFLLTSLLLALFLVGSVCTTNDVPSRACTVDVDGTCVNNSNGEVPAAEADIEAIQLPGPDQNLMYTVGYGVAQHVIGEDTPNTLRRLKEMVHYMERVAPAEEGLLDVLSGCVNKHELCAYWAVLGECDANPKYMLLSCAPACLSCNHLKFETRCPLPKNMEETNIWAPGDMGRMFERIVREYPTQVTVLSRPNDKPTNNDDADDEDEYDRKPWVVTIDDFLTPHECDTLIELGAIQGYERSTDVGARNVDGTYASVKGQSRTSTNSWCVEDCYANATVKEVLTKLEKLTLVPDANSEYLQLLKYETGQFYRSHHDYIVHHLERAQGVRILTVFLYLNDVESGGGTRFTDLDITCQAKKGRALVWPSVLDDQPNVIDENTHHEALPVGEGSIKYGANAWFHMRDFKVPFQQNCI